MEKPNDTPKCVTTELFENALRAYFKNENIKILKYTTKTAVSVGENYASDIFRSTITYSTGESKNKETMSAIIKCFPQNEMMRGLVEKLMIFEGEAYIYMNILPAINNILGNDKQISAKCIHYVKDPHTVIIFEDLSVLNFKMHPRQQGLDLQHTLLIFEKLAYLHAASHVLYKKDSSPVNIFTEGLFGTNDFIAKWVPTGFNNLIKVSSKWEGFEMYNIKLKAIQNEVLERTFKSRTFSNFNVLNHGDSWINNFMFSYNSDGTVKDLRFVDFQIVLYGSPSIDLNYCFATSPTVEVRKQHLNTLLDHYYKKFIETLNKLKHPLTSIPSRKQLQEDFNSRAFYGLASAVTVLPVVTATSRNDATLEAMIVVDKNQNDFQHDAFNNELYRKHMEFLLPFYDSLGILD